MAVGLRQSNGSIIVQIKAVDAKTSGPREWAPHSLRRKTAFLLFGEINARG